MSEVPKKILNLVENIKCLLTRFFSNSNLEYCSWFINKDADVLTKKTHM